MKIGLAPSKLLIPLSYMTVLGGMITLIGTLTILVDGVAVKEGLKYWHVGDCTLGIAVTLAEGHSWRCSVTACCRTGSRWACF